MASQFGNFDLCQPKLLIKAQVHLQYPFLAKHDFTCIAAMCLLLVVSTSCQNVGSSETTVSTSQSCDNAPFIIDSLPLYGALMSTHFKSLEDFQKEVTIVYDKGENPSVTLMHCSEGHSIKSELTEGINEGDFRKAKKGNWLDKLSLAIREPSAIWKRKQLLEIVIMARRRRQLFGENDVAFYDLAEQTMFKIDSAQFVHLPKPDTGEKGYINTFNHVTAQALVTVMYAEELADYIADLHERHHMPSLITGDFTEEELSDIDNNPLDNYVDIVNNEWGQELGKRIRQEHNIGPETIYTPEVVATFLNATQEYYSRVFDLRFNRFTAQDSVVVLFSKKVMTIRSSDFTED